MTEKTRLENIILEATAIKAQMKHYTDASANFIKERSEIRRDDLRGAHDSFYKIAYENLQWCTDQLIELANAMDFIGQQAAYNSGKCVICDEVRHIADVTLDKVNNK